MGDAARAGDGSANGGAGLLPHFPQLDGLRAFAALAVLVQHSMPVAYVNLGLIGVKLFFVLSGFLITGILLRERAAHDDGGVPRRRLFLTFYARRALRIFPLYYLALAIGLALGVPALSGCVWWHLTYTTNFLVAWYGDFDPAGMAYAHFWTLAIEEQFYLFWPFLLLLIPARWLVPVLVGLIAAGPLTRAAVLAAGYSGMTAKVVTPACFDSLGLGALLAVLMAARPAAAARALRAWWVGPVLAAAAVLVVAGPQLTGFGYRPRLVLEDFFQSVFFAWLVGRAALGFRGPAGAVLGAPPVVYLGRISYGIYVYQGVVPGLLYALGWAMPEPNTVAALFFLPLVTIPAAMLSWHCFEKPLNDLKRYFPYPAPVRRDRPGGPEG